MDSQTIESLPNGGGLQPDDMFAIQRQVGGVWNDYNVLVRDYFGPVQVKVIDWTPTSNLVDEILPSTGDVVVLAAWMTFTPGNTPSGFTIQAQITSADANNSMIAEVVDSANAQGAMFYVQNAIESTPWSIDNNSVQIGGGGGASYSGTVKIRIMYTEV